MAKPASRSQHERSAAMQTRLLDATISALYAKGYRGTTLDEVQQRAGVSRGALLHHYGSRAELMVAAVHHLGRTRIADVLDIDHAPPASGRIEWATAVLWSSFQGPLYTATLELWLAARADPELLEALLPHERSLGLTIRSMAEELFGSEFQGSPYYRQALDMLLDAMRGAAARTVLRGLGHDDRLLATWTELMVVLLETEVGPTAERTAGSRIEQRLGGTGQPAR